MVRIARPRLGNNRPWLGPPLSENFRLFFVGARAGNNLDDDVAENTRLFYGIHKLTCEFLRLGMKRHDARFGPLVESVISLGDLVGYGFKPSQAARRFRAKHAVEFTIVKPQQ